MSTYRHNYWRLITGLVFGCLNLCPELVWYFSPAFPLSKKCFGSELKAMCTGKVNAAE